jgi:hypothetical protein
VHSLNAETQKPALIFGWEPESIPAFCVQARDMDYLRMSISNGTFRRMYR